ILSLYTMPRPSHSDHVLQQLNNQREWGFLCDCCIAIGDIYFRAHRAVLAACSSYFRMMFIKDQPVTARLNLSNLQISAECFDLILQLMYLGRISVGPYEFEELKAAMVYLQMYYIPESLEDLKDVSRTNLTPSLSSSKMIFGVRMYEQKTGSVVEAERLQQATSSTPAVQSSSSSSSSSSNRQPDDILVSRVMSNVDTVSEQPCDLRKKPCSKVSHIKERPRFGRTYTCDDCGFVFSCEKLLIEHILTCTNRKAFQAPKQSAGRDNRFNKTESSVSESSEDQNDVCKMDTDWPEQKSDTESFNNETVIKTVGVDCKQPATRNATIIKIEPEESSPLELNGIKVVQVSDNSVDNCVLSDVYEDGVKESVFHVKDDEAAMSGKENSKSSFKIHLGKRDNKGTLTKAIKEERLDTVYITCELCGITLTEEDQSSHYISSHMGHICACGKCGQILIKGQQLQEHAQRCGETTDLETDGIGDESVDEEKQLLDEGLSESDVQFESDVARSCQMYKDACFTFRCPHCSLRFENEKLVVDHMAKCAKQNMFKSTLAEQREQDHRRKHFCSICGKGFYQRCHLREHYTVHTKQKQFSCVTCGKQFLRERQLRLHNDMHKGMARYICPVCDQGTFLKHDHVRHMISHLSAGETICQVCFQIFSNSDQLEQHMDVHLYICGVCGEKFRLRKDMRIHYNSKHKL
ncbi:UNVERIFIED_CONTAM: hypothetical protein FKN15_035887, partial [Acipenser sinensis]